MNNERKANPTQWKKFEAARNFFVKYANSRNGCVFDAVTPDGTNDLVFTVEVDLIDFSRDVLKEFLDILPQIGQMKIRNIENNTLSLDICIRDVWDA
jgi:hypothetical protein